MSAILLLDTSSSMNAPVGGKRRIGNLAQPEQLAADLRPLLTGPAR